MSNSLKYSKLHFVKSGSPKSVEAYELLTKKYPNHSLEDCDVIVSLGGDGYLLQVLHENPNPMCALPIETYYL